MRLGRRIAVGIVVGAIGGFLAGLADHSCKLDRSMENRKHGKPHQGDSPGDALAADRDALVEFYGDRTLGSVMAWRIETLVRAGFDDLHAAALAQSDDWRDAVYAVERGCDRRLAVALVLGT